MACSRSMSASGALFLVLSSSVPLDRSESRFFLMFEVVIVSFCKSFLHGLFSRHLVWGPIPV